MKYFQILQINLPFVMNQPPLLKISHANFKELKTNSIQVYASLDQFAPTLGAPSCNTTSRHYHDSVSLSHLNSCQLFWIQRLCQELNKGAFPEISCYLLMQGGARWAEMYGFSHLQMSHQDLHIDVQSTGITQAQRQLDPAAKCTSSKYMDSLI